MKHLTTCDSRKLDLMSQEILSILKFQCSCTDLPQNSCPSIQLVFSAPQRILTNQIILIYNMNVFS